MKRTMVLVCVFAAILIPGVAIAMPATSGAQRGLAGIDREIAQAVGLGPVFVSGTAGIEISRLGSFLPDDQMEIFAKVTRWKKLTMVALGINAGAALVTLADPFVANILGILSLGFFTISSGYMAFNYRDLIVAQALTGETEPDPKFPYMASIIAAGFGMGAMTAFGFAFESEVAAIIGAVCTVVSAASGVAAVVTTNAYARTIDYPAYTRQTRSASLSGGLEDTGPPALHKEKPRFRLTVPLVSHSY